MKPQGKLKLVSQLLDLPLVDSDGRCSGIVDDVEFEGTVAKGYQVNVLLVGPGAYAKRLPPWAMMLVRLIAGNSICRVSWTDVGSIGAMVQLKASAKTLGLGRAERRAARWLPKRGAL